MKEDAKAVQTVDTVNANNKVLKLALTKACKYLRELVGINRFLFPYINIPLDDADMEGATWMAYFLDLAFEELEGK